MLEIDPVFVHIPTPPTLDEGLHVLESVHLKVRDGTRRDPFGHPTFNSEKSVSLLEATSFCCKRDLVVGDLLTTFDRDYLLLLAWEVIF